MSAPAPTDDPAVANANEPATANLADEGDRPSVTDAGGTVARFEMSYSPTGLERVRFGPPLRELVPSFAFLGVIVVVVALIVLGYASPAGSTLHIWTAERDRSRPFPAAVLAIFLTISGLGTLLRSFMRGVVVDESGIEVRALLLLGIPKLKRWAWAQVHRIVIDDRRVMLELWDSQHELLPAVAERSKLTEMLTQVASQRRITITHLAPPR